MFILLVSHKGVKVLKLHDILHDVLIFENIVTNMRKNPCLPSKVEIAVGLLQIQDLLTKI